MAKRRPQSTANDTGLRRSADPEAEGPQGDRATPVPGDRDPSRAQTATEPTEEAIRHRAYLRYLERGGDDGDAFDDWLYAERELKKN